MLPRVLVIAEAGVNHGGSIDTAMKMAEVATKAGADIVKFQTYKTKKLIRKGDKSFRELQELELTPPEWKKLSNYCANIGIEFLTTPGELDSLKFAVEELGVQRIKIGSDDLIYKPLVEAAHKTKLPLILSTGMATPQEIMEAVYSINNFSLLHCVSTYPCNPQHVNLRSISYLQNTFACRVGYSDHTGKYHVVEAAVAAGAEIIEMHFKLDGTKPIDNAVSFNPSDMARIIYNIRELEVILGLYGKQPTGHELAMVGYLRKGPDGLRGPGK